MKALAKAHMAPRALLLVSVSAALLVSLASCETPVVETPPPPVAAVIPPPPPVLMPSKVIDMAGVFKEYVERASSIDAGFTSGDSIAASLRTGETYQIDQFQRGETAYAAVVALQEPTFVASLRMFASDADGRAQVAKSLIADPYYATIFPGADVAAGLVIAALNEQGKRLSAVGGKVKQAAYDVQHQSWSKADVVDRAGRLAQAKDISAKRQSATEADTGPLMKAAIGETPMHFPGEPVGPPYTPLVARALAVAAMAALGEGGEEYTDQMTAMLGETAESSCLNMAKLNLYQCLAVSKPHYEDVFCLGQHILADTGTCIQKGAQVAVFVPPAPVALSSDKVTDVSTPAPPPQAKRALRRRK